MPEIFINGTHGMLSVGDTVTRDHQTWNCVKPLIGVLTKTRVQHVLKLEGKPLLTHVQRVKDSNDE